MVRLNLTGLGAMCALTLLGLCLRAPMGASPNVTNQQSKTSRRHQWELEFMPSAQDVSLTVTPAKAWIHPKDSGKGLGMKAT